MECLCVCLCLCVSSVFGFVCVCVCVWQGFVCVVWLILCVVLEAWGLVVCAHGACYGVVCLFGW